MNNMCYQIMHETHNRIVGQQKEFLGSELHQPSQFVATMCIFTARLSRRIRPSVGMFPGVDSMQTAARKLRYPIFVLRNPLR